MSEPTSATPDAAQARRTSRNRTVQPQHPTPGILEWFHVGDKAHVAATLTGLDALGVRHLRTGISWADWLTPEGPAWYKWLVPQFSAAGIDLLPCLLYTPPSHGLVPKTSSPPREPKAYADFLDEVVQSLGQHFERVELWNELNNRSEYDFSLDPGWHRCSEMLGSAAYWAQQLGKQVVLGGMSPFDPAWLELMLQRGLGPYLDVIGIHGFPDVFDPHFEGWGTQIERLRPVLDFHQCKAQVWITEAGFSTWQHDERKQAQVFADLLQTPVERFYWYGMHDLDDALPTVDGHHLDEREYHFGLRTSLRKGSQPKLLFRAWAQGGPTGVQQLLDWTEGTHLPNPNQLPAAASNGKHNGLVNGHANGKSKETHPHMGYHTSANEKYTLVTGGAGFIGTNLVSRLVNEGKPVLVLDNLSRAGVERNLAWLRARHPEGLRVMLADVRNPQAVREAVKNAEFVYHLAAQVAVTTSVEHPAQDFAINLQGTHHIIEAIRQRGTPPPVVFTSTNKVYGELTDMHLVKRGKQYMPADAAMASRGIGESTPLDFHSPYGCSKGAADQYVIDAARTLGLPGVVFRMSCIYGYHQHGNADQGWVAHFLIRALQGQPVTVYGDGAQVRDLLSADDLVDAFLLARDQMPSLNGTAFNIGGGVGNAVSVREVLELIEKLHGSYASLTTGPWRPGDQKYYVSDTTRFRQATGWAPRVTWRQGIERLYQWLRPQYEPSQLPRIPALVTPSTTGGATALAS